MKLYFSPGSCALASHIALAETGVPYQVEQVNLKDKTCTSGNYLTINAKGSVPCLRMENNEILTEGAVILQYIADLKPETNLMPKFGTTERYRAQEWLNYIATELHQGYSPFFYAEGIFGNNAEAMNTYKTAMTANLTKKFNYISEKLGKNDFAFGKNFSVVDAYLFTCLSWSKYINFDMNKWPNITAYVDRVYKRPSVQKAMSEQGILK